MPHSDAQPIVRDHRILVVDDDPAVREMLVRVLVGAGYVALPAASGREAVQILKGIDFDLALLDLGMPGDDGWATLSNLRRTDPNLPVIIITAWPHQSGRAKAAGAIGCFEKPLDFPVLLEAVARTFSPEAVRPTEGSPSVSTTSRSPVSRPLS